MKTTKFIILILCMVTTQVFSGIEKGNSQTQKMDHSQLHNGKYKIQNKTERLSYTIGYDLGNNFKQQNITINPELLFYGLQDAISNAGSKMTKVEMAAALKQFQEEMLARKKDEHNKKAEQNKKMGEKFLQENSKKSDVKIMPSGLQYKVFESGAGKTPSEHDYVKIRYTGRLLDGTIFDSTKESKIPSTLKVSELILGWQEALKMMKEGDIWELYLPAKLAYGERGVGGPIGPNETLIFKVHLIGVQSEDDQPPL